MKDHKDTMDAVKALLEEAKKIEANLDLKEVYYSEYRDYFDWINTQINILSDCLFLLENNRSYATIFPSIRVVFENYWVISLALNGEKYIKYFKIKEGHNKQKIFQKWQKDLTNLKQKDPLCPIESIKMTSSRIALCQKGLYDKDKSLIPFYYWLIKEYDPNQAHIGKEKKLIDNYLTPPYLFRRFIQKHKDFRSDYFDFDTGIYTHLLINSIINLKELQRLKVHYNFLSQWVHPNESKLKVSSVEYFPNLTGERKKINDFFMDRLILLYIGNLTKLFIQSALLFLDRQIAESKINGIKNREEILEKIGIFDAKTDYFWFIFNKPHFFYKYNYCVNRMWRGSIMKKQIKHIQPDKLPDSLIPYYSNPLTILKEASYDKSNTLCGNFVSPIKREN